MSFCLSVLFLLLFLFSLSWIKSFYIDLSNVRFLLFLVLGPLKRESTFFPSLHFQTSGSSCDQRLAIGALLVEEMRSAVALETSFNCSAGVSHSKMFAKYACGVNKPNSQTVLPIEAGKPFNETSLVA